MTDMTDYEAYVAMYLFLESEYDLTASNDIGGLLGSMAKLPDGGTADPDVLVRWNQAVKKSKSGGIDISLSIKD